MIIKEQFDKVFPYLVIITLIIAVIVGESKRNSAKEKDNITIKHDTVSFSQENPKDYLMISLLNKKVKFPEIVYTQAVLETENFTSELCNKHHNLFGLYNSKKQEFYHFNNWEESIDAYINYIQYKYKDGDYFKFLDSIGYAEDPNYIKKLKIILNE